MERQVNEILWYQIMTLDGDKYNGLDSDFENDTFAVKVYNYDGPNDWNYWHKPSGLKIKWYKYPMRGIESNMEITHEQFLAALKDSANSINPRVQYGDFEKWW